MTKIILFGKESTENNKMSINSLNTIKDTIYNIMVKYPVTRDSDELLYLKVCEHYNPTVLNKSFKQVFANRLFNGIPSFLLKLSADVEQKCKLNTKSCTVPLKYIRNDRKHAESLLRGQELN